MSEWVSSFLKAHQHTKRNHQNYNHKRHAEPCNVTCHPIEVIFLFRVDAIRRWRVQQSDNDRLLHCGCNLHWVFKWWTAMYWKAVFVYCVVCILIECFTADVTSQPEVCSPPQPFVWCGLECLVESFLSLQKLLDSDSLGLISMRSQYSCNSSLIVAFMIQCCKTMSAVQLWFS